MNKNNSILETIGNTPMVEIIRINPYPHVHILAKLEGFNPTGSIKDRVALNLIESAEQEGVLCKGKTIIEPTSGNTGIGLAMVSALKGYDLEIVMSEGVSLERRQILRSFGARLTLTPAAEGTDGAIRMARAKLASDPERYFMPDQFSNTANWMAHYRTTGPEIWTQTEGQVDALVCALGTSGTITGISRYLKEKNPDLQIVAAHPEPGHRIQGLKNMSEAIVPAIYDPSLIDVQEIIRTDEALEMSRRIIAEEGIFAGMSSGAAMVAALRTAQQMQNGNVVVVFPDRAEKYLSTPMFAPFRD